MYIDYILFALESVRGRGETRWTRDCVAYGFSLLIIFIARTYIVQYYCAYLVRTNFFFFQNLFNMRFSLVYSSLHRLTSAVTGA